MSISRRAFLRSAAATAAWPVALRAQRESVAGDPLFQHGVASGDPLGDRVVLWTRVTPPATRSAIGPIEVTWQLARDERLTQVMAVGTAAAAPERDFTAKVDVTGLDPGRTYYYAFMAGGQRSPVGRTRTMPAPGVARVRLAAASCSNYPAGFFNAYRGIANRDDLDAVLHLGDYIYESAEGVFQDVMADGRVPLAPGEAATLSEYRLRYAAYRSDPDLQDAHRRHPFIVVWDDHEIADDASAGGARSHDASRQGPWSARLAAAYRAYLEWLPVRESPEAGIRLYRSFAVGDLADLIVLDTRGLRDRQPDATAAGALDDPARTLLGGAQEAWLFDQLRDSTRRRTPWRIVGQQVLFAPLRPTGQPLSVDMWDGYPAARARILDVLAGERIADVAMLTGDLHSSWALEVSANPWGSPGSASARPLAVECVTPAISSPPAFADPAFRERASVLQAAAPHLKYLDGEHNGYVLLEVTRGRLQAEWHFVPTVMARTDRESRGARFVCERGSSRLVPA